MTSLDIIENACAYARARKQRLLVEAKHFLLVARGAELVAVLSCDDANLLLRHASTAAAGYSADALALVVEGVCPLVEMNPITGKGWERGEAERLRQESDGVDNGWVSEVQITAIAFRSGDTSEQAWPFRTVGDSVTWDGAPRVLPSTGLAKALRACFGRPVADPSRVPDPGDGLVGDPEHGPFYGLDDGRTALDIGCTRILSNRLLGRGEASLIVGSEGKADYLEARGLPNWQVEIHAPISG